MEQATIERTGAAQSHLLMGAIVCTPLLSGKDTAGEIAIIEMRCPAGCGPRPHTDPWRETFYVIEGEIEFTIEGIEDFAPVAARAGDVVSVPAGRGHAFRAISPQPARALIVSAPAGLERFFADAGEPWGTEIPPDHPLPFDRERLEAATDRHGIKAYARS